VHIAIADCFRVYIILVMTTLRLWLRAKEKREVDYLVSRDGEPWCFFFEKLTLTRVLFPKELIFQKS